MSNKNIQAMKHTIKSLAILLVAAIIPSVASAQYISAQYFESNGIAYNILSPTDNTVEVTALNCSFYHGSINIPSTVMHNDTTYDVVALGEEAFYGATLSSVTIPASVRQIRHGCFLFATGPSSITIPASVTEIEPLAFAAKNLTAINVDEASQDYRSIDGILFTKDTATIVECPRGKSGTISLPQNMRHIADFAFAYCQNITRVTLPEGLSSIGYWAFVANINLNNMIIPSSVTHISASPFTNCPALNNLSIAEGNTCYYMDGMMIYSMVGDSLLSAHKSTDTVILPNTLRYVNGFAGNKNVRYIHVPDDVTTIGDEAFNGSTLVSIDLPSHLNLLAESAFAYCHSLTRVGMPTSLDTMGKECFRESENLTSIDIPNGLQTIPSEAFIGCTALSQITWGDAVESIEMFAFADCAFTNLLFPSGLRNIGIGAFISYSGVTYMDSVVFTAPIDTVEPEAFAERHIRILQFANTTPPVTVTMPPEYGADYGCLYYATIDSIVIPCGTLNAYLTDDYWRQFADKYGEDCGTQGIDSQSSILNPQFSIYPNPTTCQLHINANGQPIISIDIHSIKGQPVVTKTFQHSDSQAIIDLSSLPAGTYYLSVKCSDTITRHKVVKM